MAKLSKKHIPNTLSLLRIFLILPMVVSWFLLSRENAYWVTFISFAMAALTDFLDGHLARKWNVSSDFGAMIDQITDKLVVTTVLLFLLYDRTIGIIPALVLLLREIYVSGLREYLASRSIAVPVSKIGKAKTMLQMAALLAVLGGMCFQNATVLLGGNIGLIVAALLALYSAYQYSRLLTPSATA